MKIVLLGPPGAGKGTHAVDISKDLGIPHISTGDILRVAVKNKTEIGVKAKGYMDKGELVPDPVILSIIGERLSMKDCDKGFVLDGFPRNLNQANLLDETLKKIHSAIDVVINLETSDKTIIKRLSGRRVCRNCGAVYNIFTMPSKKEKICDLCGGELYQRDDDKEETVLNRLKVYEAQTADLIDFYKKRGLLKGINGDLEKGAAYKQIMCILKPEKKCSRGK